MAALSKKFFTKLAADFEAVRPPADGGPADVMWQVMVGRAAETIAEEVERFDTSRFLAACGHPRGAAA